MLNHSLVHTFFNVFISYITCHVFQISSSLSYIYIYIYTYIWVHHIIIRIHIYTIYIVMCIYIYRYSILYVYVDTVYVCIYIYNIIYVYYITWYIYNIYAIYIYIHTHNIYFIHVGIYRNIKYTTCRCSTHSHSPNMSWWWNLGIWPEPPKAPPLECWWWPGPHDHQLVHFVWFHGDTSWSDIFYCNICTVHHMTITYTVIKHS